MPSRMLCNALVSSFVPQPLFRARNYQAFTEWERTGRQAPAIVGVPQAVPPH